VLRGYIIFQQVAFAARSSKRGNKLGNRGNPYLTVAAVWIVSSFGLALAASRPISSVILLSAILFLILASGYLAHKAYHRGLRVRNLGKDLISDLRRFAARIFDDFRIVLGRASAWWLQREARVREEMAEEQEIQARKREKLAQWKQRRRAQPFDEPPGTGEPGDMLRGSREERTEGERRDR
jgi:hypothetical protein